jgi:hypothetical protein
MRWMTTSWRLAASDTHLYPGARLECLDQQAARRFGAGDRFVVEFSDGTAAAGVILGASPYEARVEVDAYRTARGAAVRSRQWRIVPGDRPGAIRIHARMP